MKRLLLNALILGNIAILSACGGSQPSAVSPSPNPSGVVGQAITINSANTIPVFRNAQISTSIEIHNNAPYAISGIKYSGQSNVPKSVAVGLKGAIDKIKEIFGANVYSENIIDQTSAGICSSIPAKSSCSLQITTPFLNNLGTNNTPSASILINASYNNKGVMAKASQVYNLQNAPLNPSTGGVTCFGNVSLYPHGHSNAFGSLYCYVNGTPGTYYNLDSITTRSGLMVTNPPPAGYQLAVGSILVLNLASGDVNIKNADGSPASILNNSAIVGLDINYSSTSGTKYTTGVSVIITPTGNSPILTSGSISFIQNVLNNNSGTMQITNQGNLPITDLSISASDPAIVPTSTCNPFLESGQSCTYTFTINSQTSGSTTITASSALTTTQQQFSWSTASGPNVSSVASSTTPSFLGGESVEYTVTMTNAGDESVTFESVPVFIQTGNPTSMVATASKNVVCQDSQSVSTGTVLLPGFNGSCSYTVHLTDAVAEQGFLITLAKYSYINTKGSGTVSGNTNAGVTWTSLPKVPAFQITVTPSTSPTLNGNGESAIILFFKIINNGSVPGIIESITNYGTGPFTLDTTGCQTIPGKSLAQGESCTYTITFGPTSNPTTSIESGVESSVVKYDGGTMVSPAFLAESINWSVTPDTQNLVLSSFANTYSGGSVSGSGTSADKFIESGFMTGISMTLIYTNNGSSALQINGIQDNVSSLNWTRDNGLSSCNSKNLLPGDSCSIVYDYQYNYNSIFLPSPLANADVSLPLPNIIFVNAKSGAQFNYQVPTLASENTIYAQAALATWSNTVSENYTGNINAESFVMTSTITNAYNYDPSLLNESIIVSQSQSFNGYANNTNASMATCSFTTYPGNFIVQNCSAIATPTSNFGSIFYVNPNYVGYNLNFNVSFMANTGNQGFSIDTTNFLESF